MGNENSSYGKPKGVKKSKHIKSYLGEKMEISSGDNFSFRDDSSIEENPLNGSLNIKLQNKKISQSIIIIEEEVKNESSDAKAFKIQAKNQPNKNNLFQDYEEDVPDEIVASVHDVNKIRSGKQGGAKIESKLVVSPMLDNPDVSQSNMNCVDDVEFSPDLYLKMSQ